MKIKALLVAAFMLISASGAFAVTTIYGMSGLIETPDDTIKTNGIGLTFNQIVDIGSTKNEITTYGGSFGLGERLELSGVIIDADNANTGDSSDLVANAKFSVLKETLDAPSITIGVVDAFNQLDEVDARIDDPSFFIVFGKNLTPVAEDVSGLVSKPVRGTVGFGTGIYKGVFAGLSWSLTPKLDVMVEYLTKGLQQDKTFNGGVEFTPIDNLKVRAGLYDFDDFYFGASYTISTY